MNDPVMIQLELPADPQYLSVLGVCLNELLSQAAALTEQTRYNIGLAAHEVCANMVEHAYAGASGRVAVTMTLHAQAFDFQARDQGACVFDPTQVPEPDPTAFDQRGRGLWLVRQLTDAVTYAARDGRTWHAELRQTGWRAEPLAAPRENNLWSFRKDF